MIPALAIATPVLAVLQDNDGADLDELFQRAVALHRSSLFWDEVRRLEREGELDTNDVIERLVDLLLALHRSANGEHWREPFKTQFNDVIDASRDWERVELYADPGALALLHALQGRVQWALGEAKSLVEIQRVLDACIDLFIVFIRVRGQASVSSRDLPNFSLMPFCWAYTSPRDVVKNGLRVPVFDDHSPVFLTGRNQESILTNHEDVKYFLKPVTPAMRDAMRQFFGPGQGQKIDPLVLSWDTDNILVTDDRQSWKTLIISRGTG